MFANITFLFSLFIGNGIAAYAIATIFLAMVIKLSKIPFKMIIKGLKAIIIILLITVSFNLFLTDGEVIFKLGFLMLYQTITTAN